MVRVGRVVLNGIFKKHTQSVTAPFKSRSPFVPCILFSGTRTIYFRPWLSGRIRCGQVSLRRGTLTIITADTQVVLLVGFNVCCVMPLPTRRKNMVLSQQREPARGEGAKGR